MDKRNKLRFTTSDNTFNLTRDTSIILNPKLNVEEGYRSAKALEQDSMDFPSETSAQEREEPSRLRDNVSGILAKARTYWIYASLVAIIMFLLLRPSEYNFLLDEVHRLREENKSIRLLKPMENICDIAQGATVGAHSELYKFGFLGRSMTDPNSLMEPGASKLAIKSSKGFFEIKFKGTHSIKKIAFYHPASANPSSAIREFSIRGGEREIEFEYQGREYQEFFVDGIEDNKITVIVKSNHGEPRYTSIYRMFVFV